jgi:hypothetical protein
MMTVDLRARIGSEDKDGADRTRYSHLAALPCPAGDLIHPGSASTGRRRTPQPLKKATVQASTDVRPTTDVPREVDDE